MSYTITKKVREMLPGEAAVAIPGMPGEPTLRHIASQVVEAIEVQASESFGDRLCMLTIELEVKTTALVVLGGEEGDADDKN